MATRAEVGRQHGHMFAIYKAVEACGGSWVTNKQSAVNEYQYHCPLGSWARMLYGSRVLRAHGFYLDCLEQVFRSTVLAKLLYASPACSPFFALLLTSTKWTNLSTNARNSTTVSHSSWHHQTVRTCRPVSVCSCLLLSYLKLYNTPPPPSCKSSEPYNLRPAIHNFILSKKHPTVTIATS